MTERTLAGKDKLTSTTLLSDQRGAVALEMPFVCLFMMMSLLVPLADLVLPLSFLPFFFPPSPLLSPSFLRILCCSTHTSPSCMPLCSLPCLLHFSTLHLLYFLSLLAYLCCCLSGCLLPASCFPSPSPPSSPSSSSSLFFSPLSFSCLLIPLCLLLLSTFLLLLFLLFASLLSCFVLSPLLSSTPTCSFIPNYHSFPFFYLFFFYLSFPPLSSSTSILLFMSHLLSCHLSSLSSLFHILCYLFSHLLLQFILFYHIPLFPIFFSSLISSLPISIFHNSLIYFISYISSSSPLSHIFYHSFTHYILHITSILTLHYPLSHPPSHHPPLSCYRWL